MITGEHRGLAAAITSTVLGGSIVVVIRALATVTDPVTLGAVRFAGGAAALALLLPLTGARRPAPRDWIPVGLLGLLAFAVAPVLINLAFTYTTAARGSLTMSTLPLMTLFGSSALGFEQLTARKVTGVVLAMAGVACAIVEGARPGLSEAWRGDLVMLAAAACMTAYGLASRGYVARLGAVPFTTFGMCIGGLALAAFSAAAGGYRDLAGLSATQLVAMAYLAVVGGAAMFLLWAYAIGHAPPTRVAITATLSPAVATILGATLLQEPITPNLLVGVALVMIGIALAFRGPRRR